MTQRRPGQTTARARTAVLADLLRTAARLDRTQSDPVVAARNAIGVALPLAIGALAGNAALGLAATIGALQTAFADRPGPYRLRMLRMLGTAFAAAVTSTLAVLLSRSDVGSALLLLVLGFAAGLLLTAGPSATQVGVAATAAALVLGHLPQSPSVAWHVGLLVLAGGVGQAVLAIAAWPLRRHRPERLALAGLYRELAAAARQPTGTHVGPPASVSLTAVRQTLYGLGHDHGPSVEAYRVLLDEAERIRRELLVLSAQAERLTEAGATSAAETVHTVLATAGDVLGGVAAALDNGREIDPGVLVPIRQRMRELISVLDDPETPGGELTRRAAAARAQSLAAQLRAVVETTRTGATEGGHDEEPDGYGVLRLRDPVAILRANLTPDSAVLRHAVRVGVLVAASDFVVRLAGTDRGYWIPLTVLVVLRPDFASTFQRSSMRVAGTIVGLLVASELVHWIPGGQWYQVALVGVLLFGMRFAGPGNIALASAALAALVVVLLSINGVAPHSSVIPRGADTLIGGALALVAALFWPVWERQLLPERLAEVLAAYRDYLEAVIDPSSDDERLQKARAAARLARTNAQASLDRARSEPVRGQGQVELGEAVLAHTHRFIHAMLTIDAVRGSLRKVSESTNLTEFMALAAEVLDCCEQSIRLEQPPQAVPKLRPAEVRLARALAAEPARAGDVEAAGAIVDACDRITDSLDTLVNELRRQLGAARDSVAPHE
ncbi:MAG: hypothetical protein QOF87_350 [Pseudonocardiales bacterium]|nr:hypothetical protein [Pseudonocardiales bacterium]MDT4960703.1 hypothetical protein [Pseudonocardiales bacterium]